MKARFILIAWPEDHEEDLAEHACNIQDMLDVAMMGGARVIAPLPQAVIDELDYPLRPFPPLDF